MLGMGGEDRGKPYEFKFFQGHIWTNVMADVEFDVDRTLRSRSPVRSPDWILALCWSDPYNLSTTVLKVIRVGNTAYDQNGYIFKILYNECF